MLAVSYAQAASKTLRYTESGRSYSLGGKCLAEDRGSPKRLSENDRCRSNTEEDFNLATAYELAYHNPFWLTHYATQFKCQMWDSYFSLLMRDATELIRMYTASQPEWLRWHNAQFQTKDEEILATIDQTEREHQSVTNVSFMQLLSEQLHPVDWEYLINNARSLITNPRSRCFRLNTSFEMLLFLWFDASLQQHALATQAVAGDALATEATLYNV